MLLACSSSSLVKTNVSISSSWLPIVCPLSCERCKLPQYLSFTSESAVIAVRTSNVLFQVASITSIATKRNWAGWLTTNCIRL